MAASQVRQQQKQRKPKPDTSGNGQLGDTTNAQDKALNSIYGVGGNAAGSALIAKLNPNGLSRVSTSLPGSDESKARLGTLSSTYANPSAAQAGVLERMKAGLGGYTSPEMQGMREQQERAANSNFATATSQLAKAQARGKVYGAAAGAQFKQLNTDALNSKNDQAQKLMIANADEQQKRLSTYGAAVTANDASQFDRQSKIAQSQNDLDASLRDETLSREKINLGQESANLGTNIGLYSGAAGTAVAKEQNKAGNKIAEKGINAVTGGETKEEKSSTNATPAQKAAAKKVGKKK